MLGTVPQTMPEMIADLYRRMADHERKTQNKKRTGTIEPGTVDAKAGTARVRLGVDTDGEPFLSPPVKWQELAMGRFKFHIPPSDGEQVDLVSETGDFADAKIVMSTASDDNPRPHDKDDEAVITVGNFRLMFKDGMLRSTVGGCVLEQTEDKVKIIGKVEIEGDMKLTGILTHVGDNNQTGVHKDSRGFHR